MQNTTNFDLSTLTVGKRTKICSIKPAGSLIALKTMEDIVKFSLRYTKNKKDEFIQIGVWDAKAPKNSIKPTQLGYSLAAAVRQAEYFSHENNKITNNTGITLKQSQVQKIKNDTKQAKEEKEKKELAKMTFGLLLDIYLETLAHAGTKTDVGYMFSKIPKKLRDKQANLVARDDIYKYLSSLDYSKPNMINNTTRYMSAAFNRALKLKIGTGATSKFIDFKITQNPASKITVVGAGLPNKNPFFNSDLQKYSDILRIENTKEGAMLRIHLFTGGLRMAQLCRLKKEQVNWDDNLFVLSDLKSDARDYATPIIYQLKKDFEFLAKINNQGEQYLFSLDGGVSSLRRGYLTTAAKKIVGDRIQKLQLKRVRSGHTTLMGQLKILPHIKNHLQSHGESGVVGDSYDSHGYLEEKLEALTAIYSFLNPPSNHLKLVV